MTILLIAITSISFSVLAQFLLKSGLQGVPFEGVQIPKDEKGKKEMLAKLFEQNQKQSPNSL